jgi:hypothetical protein
MNAFCHPPTKTYEPTVDINTNYLVHNPHERRIKKCRDFVVSDDNRCIASSHTTQPCCKTAQSSPTTSFIIHLKLILHYLSTYACLLNLPIKILCVWMPYFTVHINVHRFWFRQANRHWAKNTNYADLHCITVFILLSFCIYRS